MHKIVLGLFGLVSMITTEQAIAISARNVQLYPGNNPQHQHVKKSRNSFGARSSYINSRGRDVVYRPANTASRANASRPTVARTTVASDSNASRGTVQSRAVSSRAAATNAGRAVASGRGVSSRGVASRTTTASGRANAQTRNVVSRNLTTRTTAANTRGVRARTAVAPSAGARVSLAGSAIRGNKNTDSSSYSYLTSKLYTGNYSNIIDSTTGLISNDAYNNCLESYYTCMDEICTARNVSQRRCACAGRVKAFAEAETALETANEELIKVSGELALLIANKGKDISDAFQLTEAEQVMNCVSWQDMNAKYSGNNKDLDGNNIDDGTEWCQSHGYYDTSKCSGTKSPDYCTKNDFGFNVANLNGSSSDILASLQAWADAKEATVTILTGDEDNLMNAFTGTSNIVSGLAGFGGTIDSLSSAELEDTLAETWGYDLFVYAHNNVCSRVLDACFNGIYEACGSPSSFGGKCANGQSSSCPFNYNSVLEVSSAGDVTLNERGTTTTTNSNATCFGYTSASGDPYSNLRGPVADARRSILNKYLLDANADCDAYGEELRATAQNIGYQKVAAQQALQQKRLEFATEERETVLADAVAAGTNFNECISEILDCYETQARSNANWTVARIKTYCAQVSNVPHCYEEMICNPSTAQFKAVIDKADSSECLNSQDYTLNTCRNIVTLNEILNGTGSATHANIPAEGTGSSMAMREQCLLDAGIEEVREWTPEYESMVRCSLSELPENARAGYKEQGATTCTKVTECVSGYILSGNKCVAMATDCTATIANAKKATRKLDSNTNAWGECVLESCNSGYEMYNNACMATVRDCPADVLAAVDENASAGVQTWGGTAYGPCTVTECKELYELDVAGKCLGLVIDGPFEPIDGPIYTDDETATGDQ